VSNPSDEALAGAINYKRLYDYRFKDVDQGGRAAVWGVLGPWLWERMGRPERVLDPAAGRFEFLNAIGAEERWAVDQVDTGFARHPSIRLEVGDAQKVVLPTDHFDGVFVSHFLEHLPSQQHVALFLRHLLASTAPGGTIAILGPNFRYCASQYFDCADHVVPLSHVSVAEHLHAAGYEVTEVIPRFLPFSFRSALPPSSTLTAAYLRLTPAWRLLGKQLLVLARKPISRTTHLLHDAAAPEDPGLPPV